MHCFLRLLQNKGKLGFLVTQNIDDIEKHVGINKVSQAHGSYSTAIRCVSCGRKMKHFLTAYAASVDDAVLHCEMCGSVAKPGIVFFGENLTVDLTEYGKELAASDLLLVAGTSLKVAPVSRIPEEALAHGKNAILFNNERVG